MFSSPIALAHDYLAGIRSHTLKVGGYSYSYFEGGKGSTVILMHGLAGNKTLWRPFMARLIERYHVIALDMPAISIVKQLPERRGGLHHLYQWLECFLQHRAFDDVHLVGHSVSAALAAYVASKNRQNIASLTLLGLPQWYSSADMPVPVLFGLTDLLDATTENRFDTFMDYNFYRKPATPLFLKKTLEYVYVRYREDIDALLKDMQKSMVQLPARMLQIECPVLLINGEQDRYQSADLRRDLRTYLPYASETVIPYCGHGPHIEKAQEFAASLESFLEQHVKSHRSAQRANARVSR